MLPNRHILFSCTKVATSCTLHPLLDEGKFRCDFVHLFPVIALSDANLWSDVKDTLKMSRIICVLLKLLIGGGGTPVQLKHNEYREQLKLG